MAKMKSILIDVEYYMTNGLSLSEIQSEMSDIPPSLIADAYKHLGQQQIADIMGQEGV